MSYGEIDQEFEEHNASVAALDDSQPKYTGGVLPNPLIDDIKALQPKRGVLIPLKTTQEVRQDHTIVHALITRAPTKSANEVISLVPSLSNLHLT